MSHSPRFGVWLVGFGGVWVFFFRGMHYLACSSKTLSTEFVESSLVGIKLEPISLQGCQSDFKPQQG